MISCADFPELLYAFVANELPTARREEIEAHLASCPDCTRLLQEYRQVIALGQQLPDVPPPKSLLERLRAAVEEPPRDPPATD
jgi:anti-sigma factor RsiW